MRSTNKEIRVLVGRNSDYDIPNYLHLIHRHFEKEIPTATSNNDGELYHGQIDMMRKTIPPTLLNDVEEVTLVYKK